VPVEGFTLPVGGRLLFPDLLSLSFFKETLTHFCLQGNETMKCILLGFTFYHNPKMKKTEQKIMPFLSTHNSKIEQTGLFHPSCLNKLADHVVPVVVAWSFNDVFSVIKHTIQNKVSG
jgi:hypothetical protein